MPENIDSNIWIWKEPDRRWMKKVISQIKEKRPMNEDLIILHCTEVDGIVESIPIANYVLSLCQKFNVFESERMMFLCPKDLFLAIELCLERQAGKSDTCEIEISDDDIIHCHQSYIEQFHNKENNKLDKAIVHLKKFIKENNSVDLWFMNDQLSRQKTHNKDITEHLSNLNFLILGPLPADILKSIISVLAVNDVVLNVTVETPLDVSLRGSPSCTSPSCSPEGIQVNFEPIQIEEIVLDSESELNMRSATEECVEDIMVAFLSLLVNSRNELSLSKAMISPIIDLSHEAFTKLKHLAEEKEMPMCQTAISYVTRMKLGGKGYAPTSDCPMLPHLKSLELFVDTLNQMQTLIEEDLKPISALKRLINILTKKLLKCGSEKLKPTAIETASGNLKGIAEKVINIMKSKECSNNGAPLICQEGLDVLHYFVNYVNSSCSTFDPQKILLEKNSKRTPINLPPLLGYFRSPEDETSCEASEVNEDSIIPDDSSLISPVKPLNPVQPVSYFHHSDNSSISVTCVDYSCTPSKTSFKNCLEEENSITDALPKIMNKVASKKGRKRSILGELTNEILDKSEKPVEGKPKKQPSKVKEVVKAKVATTKKETKAKQKGGKKFKLVEGQGKITSFFTMK